LFADVFTAQKTRVKNLTIFFFFLCTWLTMAGGGNADIPGANHYYVDYKNRSPSMYKNSFNGLAFVEEPLTYLGKTINGTERGTERRSGGRSGGKSPAKYDARGLSYDRIKKASAMKRQMNTKARLKDTKDQKDKNHTKDTKDTNDTNDTKDRKEVGDPLPLLLTRSTLEQQSWFKHGSSPVLHHGRSLKSSTHGSTNMKKAIREKKRLQIDTVKLGNVFFNSSPEKLKPNGWEKRLDS